MSEVRIAKGKSMRVKLRVKVRLGMQSVGRGLAVELLLGRKKFLAASAC
jgi:hypothetical protein